MILLGPAKSMKIRANAMTNEECERLLAQALELIDKQGAALDAARSEIDRWREAAGICARSAVTILDDGSVLANREVDYVAALRAALPALEALLTPVARGSLQ